MLNQLNKHNFVSLTVLTNSKWDLELLDELLHDYADYNIVNFLRYGFPISQNITTGCQEIPQNWLGTLLNQDGLKKYFQTEIQNEAVLAPFQSNPFNHEAFFSPLNTRDKKDGLEKCITVDMSFPEGKC